MPVRAKCTKFSKKVPVQRGMRGHGPVMLRGTGQVFWIFESEDIAKGEYMYEPGCLTVESLKLKD